MAKEENKIEQEIKRCFVMMPFTTPEGYEKDHFVKIYDQIIKQAVTEAGFEPVRVDENNLSTSIVSKIFDGLINCEMAICDLSSRNPNVLYELGIRQAYNKPVVLIKDEKTDFIFDVSGITTIEYQSMRLYEYVIEAKKTITQAIKNNSINSSKVVDIIKATSAPLNTTSEMSETDRNSIILQSLVAEIENLKGTIVNNSFNKSLFDRNNCYIDIDDYYRCLRNELDYIQNYLVNNNSHNDVKYREFISEIDNVLFELNNNYGLDLSDKQRSVIDRKIMCINRLLTEKNKSKS